MQGKDMNVRPMIEYIKQKSNGQLLTGAEIGVRHGTNSKTIMEYLNIEKLYSIDSYKVYTDSDNITYNRKFRCMNKTLRNAKHILSSYIKQGRCMFIINSSKHACNDVPGNMDFVYIDGCHKYDSVFEDCVLWFDKVRCGGGVVGGHDYTFEHDEVREAVNDFCKQYNLVLFTKFPDWWVVKG